ncbi:MAG: flagellar hook-basal body complex protein [Elusimicrobiota bacterium]
MMPALFSGVSGLKNHQFRLNVIGNNLSNVNTIGYKYNRVTFSDLVYQNVRDASAAQNGLGGTNPVQMGLGALVNTVDMINSQGNLESTGKSTDLAIQGNGYFVLGDDSNRYYTRAGNMAIGVDGTLFNPSNGLKFMGWKASNGAIDTSNQVEDVSIPIGQALAAQPTSNLVMAGNLDATGTISLGTITQTPVLLAKATGSDLATLAKNGRGISLGLNVGDVINITGNVGGTAITGQTLTVTALTSVDDIAAALQAALQSVPDGDASETATVQADGSIQVVSDGSNDITALRMGISGNSVLNGAFAFPSTIVGGGSTGNSDTLMAAADGTDALVDLFDATGNSIGLVAGDDVTLISAISKGSLITNVNILSDITNGTTYETYKDALKSALFTSFPLFGEDMTVESDGSLKLTGAVGASNAVTGLELGAGPTPGGDVRDTFGASQVFVQSQAAVDATSFRTTGQVFDSLGNTHTVNITFTKTVNNTWDWSASTGGATVGSGVLNFSSTGEILNSTGALTLNLNNGATTPLVISIDFGTATQFGGNSSLVVTSQNGNESATLNNFSVGQGGDITGIFSNGKNILLGQLSVATFQNPTGLIREGRNLLSESPNSGVAFVGVPGVGGRGTFVAGTLEMSNVDVAREFTDMIITQRGFQANARVISTSNEMLEELVNLKR